MGVVAPTRPDASGDGGDIRVEAQGRAPVAPPLRYVPGLDGLRAIALLAVLAFHHQFAGAKGGYLGVSSFFTLSGFLITTLAIGERQRTGRLSWRRFWERRARRLVPAALVALTGVLVLQARASIGAGPRLRGDVLSALAYATNWRLARADGGYADLFAAPSPVVHFWSLAIEEQFYLVFPLAFAAVATLVGGRLRRAAAVVGGAAVASFGLAWASAGRSGNDGVTYYGTHTRAGELLVGVALAYLVAGHRGRPAAEVALVPGGATVAAAPRRATRALRSAGPAAAGAAALAGLALLWTRVAVGDDRLFRGVTAANALLTAVVIVAAVEARPFDRALGCAPVRAIGRVSYGAYLFHWPLFLLLTAERTRVDGRALFAVRLAATLAAATLSYWAVERPFRFHLRMPRPRLAGLTAVGAVAVAVLACVLPPRPAAFADLHVDVDAAAASGPIPNVHETGAVLPAGGPADVGSVMLAGDSVAWSLLAGFDLWDRAHLHHTFQVDTVTSFGCPVGDAGEVDIVRVRPTGPECDAFRESLSSDLAARPVAAIVFVMGLADLNGRELDGEWRVMGDPVHDAWLLEQLDDVATRIEAADVPAFWLTFPHIRLVDVDDPTRPWHDIPVNDPGKVDRFNELIRQTVDRHRGIELVDLAGWLDTWPDASFDPADRDGVHFSFMAAGRVVEWLAPTILDRLGVAAPPPAAVPGDPASVPAAPEVPS